MKFGTTVLILRGSAGHPKGTPGCLRFVKGVLIGARGKQRRVKLLEDDPLATCDYCLRSGDIGWWSASAVNRAESEGVLNV
jgi:hypothetical protein